MRQEIQGLRAVAVLLVVLFHLWPNRVPGGYVGVDVFFVISGFLITAHLLREVERDGSVSLARFWARRIRRLLPAAYVVLVVSALGVFVLVPRLLWEQFFGEILAAALYVENWQLALNSVDYLASEDAPSPAQHYWTLSAEEQFYLLWPLLVLGGLWLARRRARRGAGVASARRSVLAVLALTTGASLAFSLWITAANPAQAYFVTPARAWEFGAGALLAFAPAAASKLPDAARALAGWVALVALLVSSLVLDDKTPMPGTAAVWVVVASVVLIWVEDPKVAWSPSRLLVQAPARYVGDISYAVYLWHWPLIILLPYLTDHPLRTIDKLSILMATIGLSAITKRWVEDPVRAARRLGLARSGVTFGYAAAGALLLTALCVVPREQVAAEEAETLRVAQQLGDDAGPCFGAAARDPRAKGCPEEVEQVIPSPATARDDRPPYQECFDEFRKGEFDPCSFGKPRPGVPHVALVGDSHAGALMAALDRLVEAKRITVELFVLGDCPWTSHPVFPNSLTADSCRTFRAALTKHLDDRATDYDLVLTSLRETTMRGSHTARVEGLRDAWKRVTDQGVPVVAVRDNPQKRRPRLDPNFCLAEVSAGEANKKCALDRAQAHDQVFSSLAGAVQQTPRTELVDLTSFYCDARTCPVVIGGVNVYADNHHITATYARTLAPYLYRALVATGALKR